MAATIDSLAREYAALKSTLETLTQERELRLGELARFNEQFKKGGDREHIARINRAHAELEDLTKKSAFLKERLYELSQQLEAHSATAENRPPFEGPPDDFSTEEFLDELKTQRTENRGRLNRFAVAFLAAVAGSSAAFLSQNSDELPKLAFDLFFSAIGISFIGLTCGPIHPFLHVLEARALRTTPSWEDARNDYGNFVSQISRIGDRYHADRNRLLVVQYFLWLAAAAFELLGAFSLRPSP